MLPTCGIINQRPSTVLPTCGIIKQRPSTVLPTCGIIKQRPSTVLPTCGIIKQRPSTEQVERYLLEVECNNYIHAETHGLRVSDTC